MAIELAGEKDKKVWDELVSRAPGGSFTQSWAWGEVQKKSGLKIWRSMVVQDGEIKMAALAVRRKMMLGRSWLYVPRGPVWKTGLSDQEMIDVWSEMQEYFKELAENEAAAWVRIDPAIKELNKPEWLSAEWQKSEREVQPRHTLVVDLNNEEKIMAGMKQKTRYNIRLAVKKGVRVRFSKDEKDVESFWELAKEVEERGRFHYHPKEYYQALWQALVPAGLLELAVAEKDGEVLAAAWLVYFGATATYAHGASSSQRRELMGAHLLHWESMRRARSLGYEKYDFYGAAPERAGKDHPWAGITRFKEGFGGSRVTYAGAYDLVLQERMYGLIKVMRRMRAMWG